MFNICCILPYFGQFPNYFPLWLKSCGRNDNIDFLLITDNDIPKDLPANFIYKKCSFIELKQKVQSKFNFPICMSAPYKLCDFKPAYGEIFSSELKNYDFWGYIDCDLILGNSKNYLTLEKLNQYDKLYTHGHFTLFKNIDILNSIYRNLDFKRVFTSNYVFHFDEWGG